MKSLKELHPLSLALLILVAGAVAYVIAFTVAGLFQPVARSGMGGMMGSFASPASTAANGISILVAVGVMFALSLVFFRKGGAILSPPVAQSDDFSILKRALTPDETLLLEKVREVPDGITQDSLRFRLDWSKAKVSALLVNLDRLGLVQRERMGKTYRVHYQKGPATTPSA